MDALTFLRERKRLCSHHYKDKCWDGCPLAEFDCGTSDDSTIETDQEVVKIVEEWSANHPVKTRESVILELYPDCMKFNNGDVSLCPKSLNTTFDCPMGGNIDCEVCARKFWKKEI